MTRNGRPWTILRGALVLSALWLVGYVAYRYRVFNPPEHGTVYYYVFPSSLVLAGAALALAFRPRALRDLPGIGGRALRVVLTGFGAVWMATGLACTASLLGGIAAAPLGGTVDMIHMLSDHVFLPTSVALLAWAPGWLAARLGAGASVGPDPGRSTPALGEPDGPAPESA